MADLYAPKNDERYKEIEFALPNEPTLDDHKKIIETFIGHHLSDHYYAWAIHDKTGTMGTTANATHTFTSCSPQKRSTNAKRPTSSRRNFFFKKYNPRYPERGDPKKSEKWIGTERKKNLFAIREDYAKIQNDALRAAGIPLRVDHRTKKAQQEEAARLGYTTLARLLDLYSEK